MTERSTSSDETFMAAVSHELRGPLHAFLGLSELLLNSNLGNDDRRIAQSLYDEAASMRVLVDDVITYGEFSSSAPTLEEEPFAPRTLVTSIADRLRPEAEEAGLRLLVDFASDVPLRVMGDSVRFGQVVHNLISNAIRYTQIGSVQVTLVSDDANLSVRVRDSGVGIEPTDIDSIFEPFVRVGKSGVQGTGLGLAIVGRLADAMNGTIAVDSTVGVGSTFVFTIPCAPAEPKAIERVVAKSTASGTVLVVEDSEINRTLALEQLELLSLGAVAVASGEQALEFLEHESVDLVLMDWNLPGANGIETARAIRSQGLLSPDVPIIAMTANVLAGDRIACLDAGMNDHLGKPVSLDDMRVMMTRWLGHEDSLESGRASEVKSNGDAIHDAIELLLEDLGDADTVRVVLETYLAELGSRAELLVGPHGQDVSEDARRAAHTLKSTSALIGADRLAQLCAEFEKADSPSKDLRARLTKEISHVEAQLHDRLEMGIAA